MGTYAIYAKYLTGVIRGCMHIHIYHIWSLPHQPCNKELCTHAWHILMNKYSYHIQYIAHTTNMLHGNILNFLHIPKSNQLQFLLNMPLPNTCYKQICPPNWACRPYILNIWLGYMRNICAYICHIWSTCIKTSVLYKVVQTQTTDTQPHLHTEDRCWLL